MIDTVTVLGLMFVSTSLGIFAGHAAGYTRALDKVREPRGPQYRRVGTPE